MFSSIVLPRGYGWPDLPARANTAHTAPALIETAATNPATPAAVGSGKINSNCAQPTDGQTASPSPPVDLDSDVTSVASIEDSDGDSDYVESAENPPISLANTLYLAGHISKLEEMNEVAKGNLAAIKQTAVLFFHINELEIIELGNAKTNPPENHQDNGATLPVNT